MNAPFQEKAGDSYTMRTCHYMYTIWTIKPIWHMLPGLLEFIL